MATIAAYVSPETNCELMETPSRAPRRTIYLHLLTADGRGGAHDRARGRARGRTRGRARGRTRGRARGRARGRGGTRPRTRGRVGRGGGVAAKSVVVAERTISTY